MVWQLILFMLFIIVIVIYILYLYLNKVNENSYSKPSKIDESICVVKNGQTNGRKRVTYKCDDPNGCFYKGRIHKGIFYGVEDCVCDKKQKNWEYSPCGPYYGSNEIFKGDFSTKTSDLILLDPVSCRLCLSTETGHPKDFQDGKDGFSGIAARCVGKCKTPEIQISTRYENSKLNISRINCLLMEKETEIILIDGLPHILQPCILRGNSSFIYFKLKSDTKYLIIRENQVFSNEYNDNKSDVYFSFDNLNIFDGKMIGSLICYKGIHEKGWLDINFKWHSGMSKVGSLIVLLENGKLTDVNRNKIKIPSLDGNTDSLSFDVEFINNPPTFVENRMKNCLSGDKKLN